MRYETRNETIQREIIEVLGEYADQHDIDAIADQVITTDGEGINKRFIIRQDVDFWEIVAAHAL